LHVMVCGGSKQFLGPDHMAWLERLRQELPITALIPGGSRYIDSALTAWAHQVKVVVSPIPADWQRGHAHGAVRSAVYLDLLTQYSAQGSLALIALPGGEGTQHVVTQARRLGLPVYLFAEETVMPEMTAPNAPEDSPVPMLDDSPEDIADPAVPETLIQAMEEDARKTAQNAPEATLTPNVTPDTSGPADASWREHEALLHGFLTYLMSRLNEEVLQQSKDIMDVIKGAVRFIDEAAQRRDSASENALKLLSDGLAKLPSQGLQLHHDPYEATVEALSPEGFVVRLQIRKQSPAELTQALPGLTQWLKQQGFQGVPGEKVY